MGKKSILYIFLMLLPFSCAAGIKTWDASFNLGPEGFSDLEMLFISDSTASENISIPDLGCQGISLYDIDGKLDYSKSNGKIIFIPRERISNYSFSLICTGIDLTKKNGSWLFSAEFPLESSQGSIKLILPENASLLQSTPEGKVFVENSKLSLILDGTNSVSINYSFFPVAEADNELLFIFAAAFLVLILAYFSFVYFTKKSAKSGEKNKEPEEKDYLKYLVDNERKIVEVLQREKRITQRKLQIETALPKSTLSRTLKRLENKGIVKTTSAGSTKFVELADN